MTTHRSQTRTLKIIRAKLSAFISCRERAYKSVISKGHTVPDYSLKMKAISKLRTQLNASVSWDLQGNLRWVHAMRHLVVELLPYEFHDDPKQRAYRTHIVNLLNYCEELLDSKPFEFHF